MTLTIQDLGALGELLGSIAVLATLVYLAMQTRQNTMAIGAQLDAARIGASLNLALTVAGSSELLEAQAEDSVEPRSINEERLRNLWRAQLIAAQWQFIQGRRGLLPTWNERGVARATSVKFVEFRSFGSYWDSVQPFFLPEFAEWVEEQRSKAA
jgi:hypothetical protein